MTAYIPRPSHQMAAIFGCDKCSEAYTTPADLDRHRQIHGFDYDPRRFAGAAVNRSGSRSMTVGQAPIEQVVATPVVAARCFFFCSTCNARVDSPASLKRHNEQYHQPTSSWNEHDIPQGHTPQPPWEMPSPEPSWNASSAFGSPTPWEQGIQMQSAQPVSYSPTGATLPPNSPSSTIATVYSPQYVGHMPSIPPSITRQAGDAGCIDFSVPIQGHEPYNQIVEQGPDETLDSLRLLFDAGGVSQVYEGLDEESPFLPAIDLLNQLCRKYLALWQPSQPVFHPATWNGVEYSMALVSAMACIGSTFTQDSQVLRHARYISERCISEINQLTEGPLQYQDTAYIAALCIHQTYLIGSCHDQIHQHVDRVRSYMVEGLQAQNLLGPNLFDPGDMLPPSCSPETVQTEWRAWANYEQKVRVAWMVFEYDCSLSLLTGRPCAIALKHLPQVFPCEDALYNAVDAYTWAQLAPSSSGLRGPDVFSIINMTLNRISLPHTVSSWTKRLCAHVFERLLRGLWDPVEQNYTITSAREINLHLNSSLSTIQIKLLWSISYLGKSASIYNLSPSTLQATGAEVDDYEMLSTFKLNYQSDDFGMCTRIMDMIRHISLAAIISSPTDGRHADLSATQQRLILEFVSVPSHARLCVYNAGQVLRTARESLPVTPVDYLRIFGAYLAILAFVKYGPSSSYDVSGVNPFHADVFPFFPTSSDRWIEYGGPATVGECGVFYPGCSTEFIMRDASREFCSIGGWELKRRFYCVLARFNALEVRRN